jgi:hypothetical protein
MLNVGRAVLPQRHRDRLLRKHQDRHVANPIGQPIEKESETPQELFLNTREYLLKGAKITCRNN